MLTQLFSFLAQFWRALLPWVVVDDYEVAVLRHAGVVRRALEPGLRWKVPLIQTADVEDGRAYPQILDPQSLRTIDGVQVVVRLSVTCRVVDPQKYFLNVFDGRSNIQDAAGGELADIVQGSTADAVQSGAVLKPVLKRVRAVAGRWGMRVDGVKLIDASESTSYRLWQSQLTSSGQE